VAFRVSVTLLRPLLVLLFVLATQPVAAEQKGKGEERVLKRMLELAPEIVVDEIVPTRIPGLYELRIGPRIVYVTGNGRYLIQGSIVDMQTRKNLTEPSGRSATVKALETLGEDNMLVSGPKESKHTVTVFTDIDSGSSRQLHRELQKYHKKGIRIRYLFFPRAGLLSPSYTKAVSIWCSQDAMGAMDSAARGEEVKKRDCPNPIAGHMLLGEQIGVTTTPTLVLPDGRVLPGYVAPDPLSDYLQNMRPARP
jgi:thiol:disulfide interchange protein DsbC